MSRNRKRSKEYLEMADAKRLRYLKNKSDIHKEIVVILKEHGFKFVEFKPFYVTERYCSFAHIFLPKINTIIRYYNLTENGLKKKAWFERRYFRHSIIFVNPETDTVDYVINEIIRIMNFLSQKQSTDNQ